MRIGTQPKPNVTERWLRRAERRTELINTRDLVDGGRGTNSLTGLMRQPDLAAGQTDRGQLEGADQCSRDAGCRGQRGSDKERPGVLS